AVGRRGRDGRRRQSGRGSPRRSVDRSRDSCDSPRLPARPRPRARVGVAGRRSAWAGALRRAVPRVPHDLPDDRHVSTAARIADPRRAARPPHAREHHAGAVRWRGRGAARVPPDSPVGACAPPTVEYRTLLMQKSLVIVLFRITRPEFTVLPFPLLIETP